PSQEVAITSTRDGNAVANSVQSRPATITADPEQFPAGGTPVTPPPVTVGTSGLGQPVDQFGVLPDLSEETSDGAIPRMSGTGLTPFAAYRRPAEAGALADGPKIAVIVTGLGI